MFKSSNLISLHLVLLHEISFNVLYIKSNYEFTSNTVREEIFYQKQILFV